MIVQESRREISFRCGQPIHNKESVKLKLNRREFKLRLAGDARLDHPAAFAHAIGGRFPATLARAGMAVSVLG